MFRYIVKVVCGIFTPEEDMLAPGQYWTAINVYNPSRRVSLEFSIHIAIADPATAGPSFDVPSTLGLRPGDALEIDCEFIMKHAREFGGHDKKYLKGFVVIECKEELDVVAVYTAARIEDMVVTLHTERVLPRVD
jgi:hypothetical protein